ncbi:MAG: PRD domain-containing protein [Erysipelotrichaceae bacterium]
MDTIQFRLDILNKSGIINDQEKEVLEKWLEIINDFSQNFNQEKIERMITHCAMMMKRKRDNQDIGTLPDEVYQSIKEHENYHDCVQLFNKMNELYQVNSQEEKYLILHLCSLFERE